MCKKVRFVKKVKILKKVLRALSKEVVSSYLLYIAVSSKIHIKKIAFKCKICGLELPDEKRLENHKRVHVRKKKSKVYEYGDPYLDYLGKQGIQAGFR